MWLPTRILWLFVVIMGFFLAAIIIDGHVSAWMDNPTMLSTNRMPAQMFHRQIPYPSLTLCRKSSLMENPAGENGTYLSEHFHPAITDKGLCRVLNGMSMSQTYKPSERIQDLSDRLNSRKKGSIWKVQGTGTRFRKTMWLDLRWGKQLYITTTALIIRILACAVSKFIAFRSFENPISKKVDSAVIAINDVINYFNVRDKSLEIKPGNEVKIIIRPSIQTSSDAFKALGRNSKHILLRAL